MLWEIETCAIFTRECDPFKNSASHFLAATIGSLVPGSAGLVLARCWPAACLSLSLGWAGLGWGLVCWEQTESDVCDSGQGFVLGPYPAAPPPSRPAGAIGSIDQHMAATPRRAVRQCQLGKDSSPRGSYSCDL